jgi:hypothetical protein
VQNATSWLGSSPEKRTKVRKKFLKQAHAPHEGGREYFPLVLEIPLSLSVRAIFFNSAQVLTLFDTVVTLAGSICPSRKLHKIF